MPRGSRSVVWKSVPHRSQRRSSTSSTPLPLLPLYNSLAPSSTALSILHVSSATASPSNAAFSKTKTTQRAFTHARLSHRGGQLQNPPHFSVQASTFTSTTPPRSKTIHPSTQRPPPTYLQQHTRNSSRMSDGNGTPSGDKPEEPQGSEHLNIKVTDNNNEVFFKIKRSTQLGKLMNAFCDRQGKSPQSVRFLFDGQRVNNQDTPDTLEMADGDTLEVHQEQIGGSC